MGSNAFCEYACTVHVQCIYLVDKRVYDRQCHHDLFIDPVVKDKTSVGNLATVAVLPISKDVQVTSFTLELQHALTAIGKVENWTENSNFMLFLWSCSMWVPCTLSFVFFCTLCILPTLGSSMRLTSDIVKANLGAAALDRSDLILMALSLSVWTPSPPHRHPTHSWC